MATASPDTLPANLAGASSGARESKETWLQLAGYDEKRFVGHSNLAIRGMVLATHSCLSLSLCVVDADVPHKSLMAVCQAISACSLFRQCQTAESSMFVIRAASCYVRCVLIAHKAACGRSWPSEECVDEGWDDERWPLRVMAVIFSLRMALNGTSLMFQYWYPWRWGGGLHGNEQLFYRGIIQMTGIPLHFVAAMLKLGELSGTEFERNPLEVVVHLIVCMLLIPVSAWSLLDQWANSGTGCKTDDVRTLFHGRVHPNAADSFFSFMEVHKGHRNLLIRGTMTLCSAFLTTILVLYEIDFPHKFPLIFLQLLGAGTFDYQWRTGNPMMFLARGSVNMASFLVTLHTLLCGRTWAHHSLLGEECKDAAWHDIRASFRVLHVFAAARSFAVGMSLFLQFHFPHWMFGGHGNVQLFARGCIVASGVPINITRGVLKIALLDDTKWQRSPVEIAVNFISNVLTVVTAWSLYHQWFHTGPGNSGHHKSDKYEEMRRKGHSICHALQEMRKHTPELARLEGEAAAEAKRAEHAVVQKALHAKSLTAEVMHHASGDVHKVLFGGHSSHDACKPSSRGATSPGTTTTTPPAKAESPVLPGRRPSAQMAVPEERCLGDNAPPPVELHECRRDHEPSKLGALPSATLVGSTAAATKGSELSPRSGEVRESTQNTSI